MNTSAAFKTIKPHSERTLVGDVADIWTNRELLRVLVLRDISIRYRQAVVGLLWVLLQPILTTAIFTTVFVVFVRIDAGQSYPLMTFAGIAVWQYFSRIVSDGAGSLVTNSALITKVALPRMIIPMVAPVAAALDCVIALAALVVTALLMGAQVSWMVVFSPLVILGTALFGYSIALWVAPLNAVYRDIGVALPFVLQIGMYLSPIVYPASVVPEKIRWLFELNPIAVMVDAMRWAVLGTERPSLVAVFAFFIVTWLLMWGGMAVFRQMEGTLVDRI